MKDEPNHDTEADDEVFEHDPKTFKVIVDDAQFPTEPDEKILRLTHNNGITWTEIALSLSEVQKVIVALHRANRGVVDARRAKAQ